jgi:branched-chain amino acid transport system substrate-binding protein
MRPFRFAPIAMGVAVGLPAVFVGSSLGADASATPAPLTIAYITSETGAAATQNAGVVPVFEAALAAQNAQGGINGRRLVPMIIDDQTSATSAATGVQEAISRGAIGIVSASVFTDQIAKYPQQAGVPVTGDSSTGTSWGKRPNTNMFGIGTSGSVDPAYPVSTMFGKLIKQSGGTRLGVFALAVAPSSIQANSNEAQSTARVDPRVKVALDDRSVPYGSSNFGSEALIAKQNKVDVVWSNMDSLSNIGLATALKQAGVKTKAVFFPSGYDPALIHSPSWANVQGDIFQVCFHPFYEPNAGTKQMQAAVKKYAGWSKSQFPTFSQSQAWMGAELMMQGIKMAGSNPTHAGVIKALRSIKAYNGNGLLPFTINYATQFGKDSNPNCVWLTKAGPKGYIPLGKNPVCGTYLPGTTSVVSSS